MTEQFSIPNTNELINKCVFKNCYYISLIKKFNYRGFPKEYFLNPTISILPWTPCICKFLHFAMLIKHKIEEQKYITMTTNLNHNLCLHYVKGMRISFLNISKASIHSPDQIRVSILCIQIC